MNHVTHILSYVDMNMYSPEIKKPRNTDIDSVLVHNV